MNNMYYISQDGPRPLINEFGKIDDGYESSGIDNPLLQVLDDPDLNK